MRFLHRWHTTAQQARRSYTKGKSGHWCPGKCDASSYIQMHISWSCRREKAFPFRTSLTGARQSCLHTMGQKSTSSDLCHSPVGTRRTGWRQTSMWLIQTAQPFLDFQVAGNEADQPELCSKQRTRKTYPWQARPPDKVSWSFWKNWQVPWEASLSGTRGCYHSYTHPKTPIHLTEELHEELKQMEDLDVIRKVSEPTDWVSSIAMSRKSNGQLRVCLDPRGPQLGTEENSSQDAKHWRKSPQAEWCISVQQVGCSTRVLERCPWWWVQSAHHFQLARAQVLLQDSSVRTQCLSGHLSGKDGCHHRPMHRCHQHCRRHHRLQCHRSWAWWQLVKSDAKSKRLWTSLQ